MSESSSEESSTSTSASSSDEDLNKYDGYQTNDFYVAVHNLPGLDSKTAESSPKEYRTEAELLNADETLRVLTFVYIPKVDGEYQPVKSDSDKGLTQAYDSAVDVFEQEGDSFDETEYDTDNLKWRCVEATNTQGGNIDYAICVSSFAGRVVEAHRLVLSEDSGDSDKALDKLLNDFDKALSDLEKK